MRRDVLLLQGPIGPFFSRFATDLEARGFRVTKINFNGGDRFFWRGSNALDYTGTLDDWEAWIERLLINRDIGRIYLFGDCRSYHRIAREVARRRGVRVFVFEEGYIRPNFITLSSACRRPSARPCRSDARGARRWPRRGATRRPSRSTS